MDAVLRPVRIATSKPALQTYVDTILFCITSIVLFLLAVVAYISFYFSYIPQIGVERVIHMQFGDGPHPYGLASLDSSLVSQQPYDISVSLTLPRSPTNLQAGNFMLAMTLISPNLHINLSNPWCPTPGSPGMTIDPPDVIHFSRRAASLTYTSRLVSLSERIFTLPLYILGLRNESENLLVPMAESVSFLKGWKNVPSYIGLEMQSEGQTLHIYHVRVYFKAIFGGMRWWMYNHRILSFNAFVGLFWIVEVVVTLFCWLALTWIPRRSRTQAIKELDSTDLKEEQDTDDLYLSDTSRTFPTYGKQPPLKYESKIKEEHVEEAPIHNGSAIQPLVVAEADDEDEDGLDEVAEGRRSDSGLGTSFSEGGNRSGLAKRKVKGKGLGNS